MWRIVFFFVRLMILIKIYHKFSIFNRDSSDAPPLAARFFIVKAKNRN